MKVSVEATDRELVGLGDALACHLRELQDAAHDRLAGAGDDGLAKARTTIKAHPHLLLNQVRRDWLDGYRAQMGRMLGDIEAFLGGLPQADPHTPLADSNELERLGRM